MNNKHASLIVRTVAVLDYGDSAEMTDTPPLHLFWLALSDILNGSAVCVYRMEDVVRAFKGNFLHKEGPQYKWTEFTGKVPYPRPGTVS